MPISSRFCLLIILLQIPLESVFCVFDVEAESGQFVADLVTSGPGICVKAQNINNNFEIMLKEPERIYKDREGLLDLSQYINWFNNYLKFFEKQITPKKNVKNNEIIVTIIE